MDLSLEAWVNTWKWILSLIHLHKLNTYSNKKLFYRNNIHIVTTNIMLCN